MCSSLVRPLREAMLVHNLFIFRLVNILKHIAYLLLLVCFEFLTFDIVPWRFQRWFLVSAKLQVRTAGTNV